MALLTLAQLKTYGNISGTSEDTELQLYVDSVTDVVEGLLGGPVEQRTVTETVNVVDGGRALALKTRFAVSVTSITVNGAAQSTSDVYIAPGNVLRRKLDIRFGGYYPPVVVVYVAGIVAPGSVPSAVTLAAAIIGGHLWEMQRGRLTTGPGDEFQTPQPGMGFAVPNRALELLFPWLPESSLVVT